MRRVIRSRRRKNSHIINISANPAGPGYEMRLEALILLFFTRTTGVLIYFRPTELFASWGYPNLAT
jgi:hypothetical protein